MNPPIQPSPLPLIDLQRLEEVCMADFAAMVDLAEFFFSQAEEEMETLSQAITKGDAESVRRSAHRLVGSGAGCGMSGLLACLIALEEQSKQGDLSQAPDLFACLTDLFAKTRVEFEQWRQLHSPTP